jgi:iron complex transport system ATP-binding protein
MSSVSEMNILDFDRVSFSYGKGGSFIRDLSFSICNREFVGLLGANGSGKSTILKLASGIFKTGEGRINLWGRGLDSYRNRDRAKLLSYLPQFLDMSIPFTVKEFVSMGQYPYDARPELTVDDAIEMVGLAGYTHSLITNLSGGERKRVYIAMTLLQGAGLVLLDEPLANLDIKYQIELLKLLKDLREKRNITVLMALHDINIAFKFDRLMLVKEGKMLGIGVPHEVLTEKMLNHAFDIDIEMQHEAAGGIYLRY